MARPKMDQIFAWIIEARDGGEGLLAIEHNGHAFPALGPTQQHAEAYRFMAEAAATETGRTIRLVEFSGRRTLEVVVPGRRKP